MNHCDFVRIAQTGSRRRRKGPERDLINAFLRAVPFSVSSGLRISIFEEPRLQSGFPDLVLVIWDEAVTSKWRESRQHVTVDDLRVLHTVHNFADLSITKLEKLLKRRIATSLDRLHSAGLLTRKRHVWRAAPLEEIYAVREIIAIEAKMEAVSQGLEQSALNRWFATSSYLLLPNPPGENLKSKAEQLNVGILAQSGMLCSPLQTDRQPQSYASWLFNEWVWRAMRQQLSTGDIGSGGHSMVGQ